MSPPVKAFLLPLAALAHYIAFRPPNPPASKDDKVKKGSFFEQVPRMMAATSQLLSATCLMTECAVILALSAPSSSSAHLPLDLCANPSPSLTRLSTMSPLFVGGLTIMFMAAAIRIWCYRTLGRFFTFEITIRPGHELVRSGPYGLVRHPGYTSNMSMLIATAAVCLSGGSYINECQIMTTPARWVVRMWVVFIGYFVVAFFQRGAVEDQNLKKEFGAKWDQYYRDVPYKYVPGIV